MQWGCGLQLWLMKLMPSSGQRQRQFPHNTHGFLCNWNNGCWFSKEVLGSCLSALWVCWIGIICCQFHGIARETETIQEELGFDTCFAALLRTSFGGQNAVAQAQQMASQAGLTMRCGAASTLINELVHDGGVSGSVPQPIELSETQGDSSIGGLGVAPLPASTGRLTRQQKGKGSRFVGNDNVYASAKLPAMMPKESIEPKTRKKRRTKAEMAAFRALLAENSTPDTGGRKRRGRRTSVEHALVVPPRSPLPMPNDPRHFTPPRTRAAEDSQFSPGLHKYMQRKFGAYPQPQTWTGQTPPPADARSAMWGEEVMGVRLQERGMKAPDSHQYFVGTPHRASNLTLTHNFVEPLAAPEEVSEMRGTNPHAKYAAREPNSMGASGRKKARENTTAHDMLPRILDFTEEPAGDTELLGDEQVEEGYSLKGEKRSRAVRVRLLHMEWGGELVRSRTDSVVGQVIRFYLGNMDGGEARCLVDFGSDLGVQSVNWEDCEEVGIDYEPLEVLPDTILSLELPETSPCCMDEPWSPDPADSGYLSEAFSEWGLDKEDTFPGLLGELGVYTEGPRPSYEPLASRYKAENWHAPTWKLEPRKAFIGKTPGLTKEFGKGTKSPLEIFKLLWDEKIMRKIVRESNKYAFTTCEKTKKLKGGKLGWTPLSIRELRKWLGILVLMGIRRQPKLRDYWACSNEFLHCQAISETMSRERFEWIFRCLHLVDKKTVVINRGSKGFDPIVKTRVLLEMLVSNFRTFLNPSKFISVDECMVAYNGTYCSFVQYLPLKPISHGIKVWAACDGVTKYMFSLEVYVGSDLNPKHKRATRGANVTEGAGVKPAKNVVSKLGKPDFVQDANNEREVLLSKVLEVDDVDVDMTEAQNEAIEESVEFPKGEKANMDVVKPGSPAGVVLRLTDHLKDCWHVVVMDRFFTGVGLFEKMMESGFYCVGTIAVNRVGYPKALNLGDKEPRGQLNIRVHKDRQLAAVHWADTKGVMLLSSAEDPVGRDCVTQRQRIDVLSTPIQLMYLKYMRGVDVHDQLRMSYSCAVATKKWWHRLFFFGLDACLTNSYILHKEMSAREGVPHKSHCSFQMELAFQLMGCPVSSKRKPPRTLAEADKLPCHSVHDTRRGYCQFCGARIHFHCGACDELWCCLGSCFLNVTHDI